MSDGAAGLRGRRITHALRILLAVAILVWLVRSGALDVRPLADLGASWELLLLVAMVGGSLLLQALRWWWLLRIQELPVQLATAVRLAWISGLATFFLPGSLSGDAVKAGLVLRGRQTGRLRALSTVLVDRFLGLYSLVLLGLAPVLAAGPWSARSEAAKGLAVATLLLWAGLTAAGAAFAWPATRRLSLRLLPESWQAAIEGSWSSYVSGAGQLGGCLLLSLASNALIVGGLAWGCRVLGLPASPGQTFLAGPLAVLANSVPLTPGGAGVGEAATEQLFRALGLEGGAETMLLTRLLAGLWSLPAALLLLRRRGV